MPLEQTVTEITHRGTLLCTFTFGECRSIISFHLGFSQAKYRQLSLLMCFVQKENVKIYKTLQHGSDKKKTRRNSVLINLTRPC